MLPSTHNCKKLAGSGGHQGGWRGDTANSSFVPHCEHLLIALVCLAQWKSTRFHQLTRDALGCCNDPSTSILSVRWRPAHCSSSRFSSVGRASDRRSEGPWFDPKRWHCWSLRACGHAELGRGGVFSLDAAHCKSPSLSVAQLVEHVTVEFEQSQGRWFDSGR